MRLDLERHGGFAARTVRWSLDVDALDGPEQAEVEDLLAQAPDWPEGSGADRFSYRLVAEAPGREPFEARFAEPLPEPAQRLLSVIRDRSA